MRINFKITPINIIGILISAFFVVIGIILKNNYVLCISIIVPLVFKLIQYRSNIIIFLLFAMILYFNMNFIVAMVFNTENVIYSNYLHDEGYLTSTLICCSLFVYFLCVFTNFYKTNNVIIRNCNQFKIGSKLFWLPLVLCSLFCLIFGINREQTVSYQVNISSLFEILYMIFFLMILFSKEKYKKIITFFLIFISIATDLIYGGRVTSFQIFLAIFAAYSDKLKLKHLFYFVPLLILFLIVGGTRNGNELTLETFNIFKNRGLYFAFQTSESHLFVGDFISFDIKVKSLIGNIFNCFFISLPFEYNISSITHEFVNHYYGGYAFSQVYFWFGYFGPIILGSLLGILIDFLNTGNSIIKKTIMSMMFITLPRWYMYDIFIFIKFGLIWMPFVTYFACHVNDNRIYKKRMNYGKI